MDKGNERPYQLFVGVPPSAFADTSKAGWIPFLPIPGKHEHPIYGTIEVTADFNREAVEGVQNHIYQEHIPIDIEHETKLSGAVAWLKAMRMNDDGSADAYVEWTPRGQEVIGNGSFRYVSPEWFDEWTDPATGVMHPNVVAGGAITTRPFFKDQVLRALVASENKIGVIGKEMAEMQKCASCGHMVSASAKTCPDCGAKLMNDPVDPKAKGTDPVVDPVVDPKKTADPKTPADPVVDPKAPVTFSEAQTAEIQKRIDTAVADAKKAAEADVTKTFADQLKVEREAREALANTLKVIQNGDRQRRFSELVAGKGGAGDGARWAGASDKQISILERLADQFGEDSEIFKDHVENQSAIAAQVSTALFAEYGSSGSPAGGSDPDRKLEEMTKAKMAADSNLSHAKAYDEVLSSPEGAKLYQAAETARQRRS